MSNLLSAFILCLVVISSQANAVIKQCHDKGERADVTDSPSRVPLLMQVHDPDFKVFAFGAQLTSTEENFPLFPATDLGTFNLENLLLTTDREMKRNALVWANRCIKPGSVNSNDLTCNGGGNDKGNPWDFHYLEGAAGPEGKRVWAYFDSSQKANACTSLQLIYLLGKSRVPAGLRSSLRAGLDLIVINNGTDWQDLRDQTTAITWVNGLSEEIQSRWRNARARLGNVAYPKQYDRQTFNACIVRDDELFPAAMRLSPVLDGITIDYEVADRRAHPQTTALFESLAQIRDAFAASPTGRYLPLTLYTNPLNRSASASGITSENGRALLGLVDKITIHEDHMRDHPPGATGIQALSVRGNIIEQLGVLRGPGQPALSVDEMKKILLVFEMKHFSDPVRGDHYPNRLSAAREARISITHFGLGGVMLWRNGMNFEQSCESDEWKAFSCITLGYCD